MAEKEKQDNAVAEKVKEGGSGLQENLNVLAKLGGFKFLETTVAGIKNLNPQRKALKNIFLSEDSKQAERADLSRRLNLWLDLLENSNDVGEMVEKCQTKVEEANAGMSKNIGMALEETKELEASYRSMSLFFQNCEQDKLRNLNIVNAAVEDLSNDAYTYQEDINLELWKNYDRLDLRDNYSMLVVPGWMGSKANVEKYAKIAHKSKVMMLTDYRNLGAFDEILDAYEADDLADGEAHMSNVMMSCNWLAGREQYNEEEDGMFVPPSAALAGKMYKTLMSQVAAGKKFGSMTDVSGVRFPLMKGELSNLEKIGLVPMVNEYGKVMAFSAKTLFNGDNLGLQTYSVVRVFDYITKVLIDFLNRRTFENFDFNNKRDLQKQITKFLNSISGAGKLIKKFEILKFHQDPQDKTKIYLDLYLVPYFPSKNFTISLFGQKGADTDDAEYAEWLADYQQQQ